MECQIRIGSLIFIVVSNACHMNNAGCPGERELGHWINGRPERTMETAGERFEGERSNHQEYNDGLSRPTEDLSVHAAG